MCFYFIFINKLCVVIKVSLLLLRIFLGRSVSRILIYVRVVDYLRKEAPLLHRNQVTKENPVGGCLLWLHVIK